LIGNISGYLAVTLVSEKAGTRCCAALPHWELVQDVSSDKVT